MSLFPYGMMLYLEKSKDSTKNLRSNKFSKFAGMKTNIQKVMRDQGVKTFANVT